MKRFSATALTAAISIAGLASVQDVAAREPTQREILSVPSIRSPAPSPDGARIAYAVRRPDWDADRYDTEIMLWSPAGTRQLTDNKAGSSYGPKWSPDGKSIAFLESSGDIFLLDIDSGRKVQLTAIDGGVGNFKWSPDGRHMALLLSEPSDKHRTANYGAFHVEGVDHNYQHLWLLDVEAARVSPVSADFKVTPGAPGPLRRLTGGRAFTVHGAFDGDYNFTPDGREVLFDHCVDDAPESIGTQDISAVRIADGAIRPIVHRPGMDQAPFPSPDGRQIVFQTSPGPYFHYGRQFHFAVAELTGGAPRLISGGLPDEGSLLGWRAGGIYFRQQAGVETQVARMDPVTLRTEQLTRRVNRVHSADVSDAGVITYVGESAETARELYRVDGEGEHRLTDTSAIIANWPRYGVRLMRWKTADGTEVEGVLYLPADFAARPTPRPTLVFLHGGPSGTYRPVRVFDDVYPFEHWLAKGAVVFAPNYRGSGGYGDAFRARNVRKLGLAYSEDVLTGLDQLVKEGVADPGRLGAMGWSAGGDGAAFLALRTHRFKAVSVGAGTSDPVIDYVSNDQPSKTEEYLLATPWSDPRIYQRVSPMAGLATANTPTLVQHGRNDRRVSLVNAMELYRGLTKRGVDTALILYDRSGHYPDKPSDQLGAAEHNRRWFDAYLFGEGGRPDLSLSAAASTPTGP